MTITHLLATDAARSDVTATLPAGEWRVVRWDLTAMAEVVIDASFTGGGAALTFTVPAGPQVITASPITAPPADDVETVVSTWATRRDRFEGQVLALNGTDVHWAWQGAQAMVLFAREVRTSDTSGNAQANSLMQQCCAKRTTNYGLDSSIDHGAGLIFAMLWLAFEGASVFTTAARSDLLATLNYYKARIFDGDADLPVNPPTPYVEDQTGKTENHKLNWITQGLLYSRIFAAESYSGSPVKDATSALDDYWHWWVDAFHRYHELWTNGASDRYGDNCIRNEKDSFQYARLHLAAYFLLVNWCDDSVIVEQSRIAIDRVLADYAENAVKGIYTGPSNRVSNDTLPAKYMAALAYLLFDDLGYPLPADDPWLYQWGFGGWGAMAVAMGAWNPSAVGFAKALIALARDKGTGYLIREGRAPGTTQATTTWVEPDLGLGFFVAGSASTEDHAGGLSVSNQASPVNGRHIWLYVGTDLFYKPRPSRQASGVVQRRCAVIRNYDATDKALVWIGDGWSERVYSGEWAFARVGSTVGRQVFAAVRVAGGYTRGRQTGVFPGDKLTPTTQELLTVWEVSTSDEFPGASGYADFQVAVVANPYTITGSLLTYTSTEGVKIEYDRSDHSTHRWDVGGGWVDVDWADWGYSVRNPYAVDQHGAHQLDITHGAYELHCDWDPDDDGDYREAPTRSVVN